MTSARGWREGAARALLALYKNVLSPALHAGVPGACRFQPTCSEYAAMAVVEHGWLRGTAMAAWRVLRCNPLNRRGGFDPVPIKAGHGVQGTGCSTEERRWEELLPRVAGAPNPRASIKTQEV
ncbi:MAG: membrane protein insertion efficiency factor YidD [Acidobacteriaceae bacterium]